MAFHVVPSNTPTVAPANAVSEEMKFIKRACLMLRPDDSKIAKSPVNIFKRLLQFSTIVNIVADHKKNNTGERLKKTLKIQ